MGAEFHIETERDVGEWSDIFPTLLIRFEDDFFGPMARQLGLTPLSDFESIGYLGKPAWRFFPAQEGLRTVQGLLRYLRFRPDAVQPHPANPFVEALEVMERVLLAARRASVGFCIRTPRYEYPDDPPWDATEQERRDSWEALLSDPGEVPR